MSKILIVEDNPEQLAKAVEIVTARGHEVLSTNSALQAYDLIAEAEGVLTDFFFAPEPRHTGNSEHWARNGYYNVPPPMGMIIVASALSLGTPVVVCTDGDHHAAPMSWVHDAFVARMGDSQLAAKLYENSGITLTRDKSKSWDPEYNVKMRAINMPFGWNDHKAWDDALTDLELRIALRVAG